MGDLKRLYTNNQTLDWVWLQDLPFIKFSSEKITDIKCVEYDNNKNEHKYAIQMYCDSSNIPVLQLEHSDSDFLLECSEVLLDKLKQRKRFMKLKVIK